jgi:subtilisin family serine protease
MAGVLVSSPQSSAAQNSPHVPGELLIAPKAGVSESDLENQYKAHGGQKIKTFSQIKVHHIKVPDQALEAIEAALRKNPNVEYVEKNFTGFGGMVPNDPGYASQWYLPMISAPQGWDISTGSANVSIAVLDSGVDPNHPDLSSKLVPGYNYVNNNSDTHDVHGHGTAVAGIAAASTNSGIGIAGVAWQNKIMPLVVFDSTGYGTYAQWISGITYAADHGAKVINMSIGGSSYSSSLQSAVNYAWNKGAVLVACAMNTGSNTPYYPAALNNVLAVSATNYYDNFASFSNYGNWIAVSAPGDGIYTTTNGGGYGSGVGTSFSTPQVAGLAALLMSLTPGLSNSQVVSLIKQNADDLGSAGYDPYFGYGRINVYRTLAATQGTSAISVAITNPSDGSVVPTGYVNVDVTANSSAGITRVELYVNGTLKDTKLSPPYSFTWNTTGLAGAQTLVSKALDAAGGSASSSPETVTVASSDKTPPVVSISSTAYDGKTLIVTGSASDTETGVVRVELYVDGALKSTDTSSPWSFKLNTKPWSKETHSLQLKAYDSAGNIGFSGTASITVEGSGR